MDIVVQTYVSNLSPLLARLDNTLKSLAPNSLSFTRDSCNIVRNLNDITQILDEFITFSLSFGDIHGDEFLVGIETVIARFLGEAQLLSRLYQEHKDSVSTYLKELNQWTALNILATAAEAKRCFQLTPMPTNTSKPPFGPSWGNGECYTENCSFNGEILPLVTNVFGSPLKVVPAKYRLWSCSQHLRKYQEKKDPLLQCDLVQKQVNKLKAWGRVVDWVVEFRGGEERRLNISLRNSGSLEGNVMPALLIGTELVISPKSVWFIGLTELELFSLVNHIRNAVEKSKKYGFENVRILPYEKGEYLDARWYPATRRPKEWSRA